MNDYELGLLRLLLRQIQVTQPQPLDLGEKIRVRTEDEFGSLRFQGGIQVLVPKEKRPVISEAYAALGGTSPVHALLFVDDSDHLLWLELFTEDGRPPEAMPALGSWTVVP